MASNPTFFLIFFILTTPHSCQPTPTNQSRFIDLIKNSTSGDSLTKWAPETPHCNYTGITCDDRHNIVGFDISGWSLSGTFPDEICTHFPKLRALNLGQNSLRGEFPRGILNCSFLQELNLTSTYFTGDLPDLSTLKSLTTLDLSNNLFSGNFPVSVANLTNLRLFNANMNPGFNFWKLPITFTRLTNIEVLILSTCNLDGEIPGFIGNMTSLVNLQMSGNFLTGHLPRELGLLTNLERLELYYIQLLEGEIPAELGNLTRLRDLDMSVNRFTGKIPESIFRLPNIHVIQLYNNSLVGEIPAAIANSTTLKTLSLYDNFLTGELPKGLGTSSALHGLDLSENHLSGRLPEGLCNGSELKYLLVLQNMFSGEIPGSYAGCNSVVRFRVSKNNLEGQIPKGILSLPNASIIDVGYNNLTGCVSKDVMYARNLSELFLQGNRLSGPIPPEIVLARNLVKIDLSNNLLSGPIPPEISNLRKLNLLFLQGNMLNSSIPESLSSLKSLNVLDLSSNRLTGQIPESLGQLLPNSMNFSYNLLSGPIPDLFVKEGLLESFSDNPGLCLPSRYPNLNFPVCHQSYAPKKMTCIWIIGITIGILIIGAVMVVKGWFNKKKEVMETEDNTLSLSFFSYEVKSFHRVSFDRREIIEAMVEKNIVGYGGSGTVYKIELNNGEVVAVKELWSRRGKDLSASDDHQLILDREMKTEVETLGSIRHKNIVKLYCYLSGIDCSILVYEYMSNGNLWDALHLRSGKAILDWPTRYQIAIGIAQGLAYLHHDLMPPIIHRDIKSTNILLDVNFQPKVADFGIAKVLRGCGSIDSSTTVIAGTYGYLAPEYAYSSKTTTKCDVYSFGVVLMEIITGRKPVEAEFGENKNIVYWVNSKTETKEGATELLDKNVSGLYDDDMIKVLRVAMCCTCSTPNLRPAMNDVVQLLTEADPYRLLTNLVKST